MLIKPIILLAAVTLTGCAAIPLTTVNDYLAQAESICAQSYSADSKYTGEHVDVNVNNPSGRSQYANCTLNTARELSDSENNKRVHQQYTQDQAAGAAVGLGIFGALLGLCAAGGC